MPALAADASPVTPLAPIAIVPTPPAIAAAPNVAAEPAVRFGEPASIEAASAGICQDKNASIIEPIRTTKLV